MLGQLSFRVEEQTLHCASKKARWLAAFVFLKNELHTRAALARLFWGSADARALGSLRVALTKLPAPLLASLDVRHDSIGVSAEVHCEVDVHLFRAAYDSTDANALRSAVDLFQDDLFAGIDAADAPDFSDWLFAERARLRRFAQEAHVALANALRARGDVDGARNIADKWLALEPVDETMHRLLMIWLAEDSGNDRALAQFEVYRRTIAVKGGAAPSAVMEALAESFRQRNATRLVRPARLAAATSFVGRENELAVLQESLRDPACRLLTVHGMGGAGKTRLALAALDSLVRDFSDGVFVAALDDVATPELFAPTVARACGLQPAANTSPLDLLRAFFQRRNALLLLDNLEHLLAQGKPGAVGGVAAMIAELLASTGPRFKILATSRDLLHLQEEWVQSLQGLLFPASDVELGAQNFAAVRLFAERAKQAGVRTLSSAGLKNVVAIATLLEGLPLGLELTASLAGSIPLPQLLAELRAHAATFESQEHNRASRHRSLGAVVAFSWGHLTEELRQALAGVSILKGGFSTEAAGYIASATPPALSALADKALLTALDDGRWHMHEVVRQFAWEQCALASERAATITYRRDDYYLGLLAKIGRRLISADEVAALKEIELENANLREAWRSTAHRGDMAALERAAPVWFDFLECRNSVAEGVACAQAWLTALNANAKRRRRSSPADAAHAKYYLGLFERFSSHNQEALVTFREAEAETTVSPRVRTQLRAACAFTHLLKGDVPAAEAAANEARKMAESLGDAVLRASACRVLGLCLLQSGRREAGRELQREALALAELTGRPSQLAAAHNNLALAENHLGSYDAAEAGYQNALRYWRDLQATLNIGRAMHNLGVVSRRRGDYGAALSRYRAALEVLRKSGDRNLIALNLMSTGDVLIRLGKPDEAIDPTAQALEMAERDGNMLPALDARIVLAHAAGDKGRWGDAAHHLSLALDGARMHGFRNVLADAVLGTARVLRQSGALVQGDEWARYIAADTTISESIRKDARDFLEEFSAMALESSAPLELSALADAALAELNALAATQR